MPRGGTGHRRIRGEKHHPQDAKKNELAPHRKEQWVIPPKEKAAFVASMEEVLDAYEQPYDEKHPLVCFDEKPVQLLKDPVAPLPPKAGQPQREDYQYERHGTASVLGFFEPLTGLRSLAVHERRTTQDFAQQMRRLVEDLYPQAETIRVVLDNLNTHKKASLYASFDPQTAARIAKKLEFIYTPKHGSWLNAIEIEFSIVGRQCLDRRMESLEKLRTEIGTWEKEWNQRLVKVDWQFKTKDARIKLKHLYPKLSS